MEEIVGLSNFSIYQAGKLQRRYSLENTEKNQIEFIQSFILDYKLDITCDEELPKLDALMYILRNNNYTFELY